MIVVVTGSRTWTDRATLYATLDDLHTRYGVEVLYHGGAADGADRLSGRWAQERGVPEVTVPYASAYGQRGGSIRNGWMLDLARPDLVVAFPDDNARGTWNCVTQAKQRGLQIRVVKARRAQDVEQGR